MGPLGRLAAVVVLFAATLSAQSPVDVNALAKTRLAQLDGEGVGDVLAGRRRAPRVVLAAAELDVEAVSYTHLTLPTIYSV